MVTLLAACYSHLKLCTKLHGLLIVQRINKIVHHHAKEYSGYINSQTVIVSQHLRLLYLLLQTNEAKTACNYRVEQHIT